MEWYSFDGTRLGFTYFVREDFQNKRVCRGGGSVTNSKNSKVYQKLSEIEK